MALPKIQVTQGVANNLAILSGAMDGTAMYAATVHENLKEALNGPDPDIQRARGMVREMARVVRFLKKEAGQLDRLVNRYLPYRVS